MSRLHAERDKAVSDVEKVREELERCQSTLGKLQLQQEKTQQGYDKAQNEVDRLQERLDKTLAESRKVNRSALSSFYRFLSDNFSFSYCCCCCLLGWWRPIDLVPFYASLIDDIDRTFSSRARRRSTSTTLTTCRPSWINRPASCRASKRRRRTSNKKWSAFGTSTTKTRQERNNPPRASGNQSLRILIFVLFQSVGDAALAEGERRSGSGSHVAQRETGIGPISGRQGDERP